MGFYSFLWKCVVLLWSSVHNEPNPVTELSPDIKFTPTSPPPYHLVQVRKYMNESIDPCESFYDFTCGNWKTHFPANESVKHTHLFDELNKHFDSKLGELLTNKSVDDSVSQRTVKTFYFSCLNQETATSVYLKEKLKQIANEFDLYPTWPNFNKRKGQEFNWLETVAKISHEYGFNIIFGYAIKPDAKDHTSHNLILGSQTFEPHYQRLRHEYEIILRHLNFQPATANGIAWEVIDFESNLLQANRYGIKSPYSGSVDDIHNKYYPDIDIKQFLNISLGYITTRVVWLENPGYLENLVKILKFTPKESVTNYIVTRLLHHFWIDLAHEPIGRMESCLKITKDKFPHALSQMFFKSNIKLREKVKDIDGLWTHIKSTLQQIFNSKRPLWFDTSTRKRAIEKLHSMTLQVATYEDHNFDREYRWLSIKPHDYIENLRSLNSFKALKMRHSLHQKPQHEHISLDLKTPVYVISSNSIIVPVSILNSNFLWSTSNSLVMNMAHLGFCIAHEIMHAFSGEGRHYNEVGNFAKHWSKEAEYEYTKLESCLDGQYGNRTRNINLLPKLHRNTHKQDENVADNAGIILAYEAFKKLSEKEKFKMDSSLSYTYEQLFFINYAQLWCSDTWQKEAMHATIHSYRHAQNELRVAVPLKNFVEFSNAFNCPKGSDMNPNLKCKFF
ncbi:membrane metallo-endopeptidase-like 1 [Musca autumnalis]|uniref:membrane metallo-endopeptidase-like 1 n=1 Tax=Musca autumnalis TaxID=221902 RepID=UPI003CEBD9FA